MIRSDVNANCPVQMGMQETEFPGYSPANPLSFAKDSDHVINCDAFRWADFLCYHAKKQGVDFSKYPNSSGCSALDVTIQLTNDEKVTHGSITEMLAVGTGFNSLENYQKTADHFSKVGVCTEAQFPSEFVQENGERRREGARNRISKMESEYDAKRKTEAGVGDPNFCPTCLKLAPQLNLNGKALAAALTDTMAEENSYLALKKLNAKACPDSSRIPIGKLNMTSVGNRELEKMRQQILEKNLVMINMRPGPLMSLENKKVFDETDNGRTTHSLLVVGAIKQLGKCYYVVKNSWGNECQKDLVGPNPARILCNAKNGTAAILAEDFESSLIMAAWAEPAKK